MTIPTFLLIDAGLVIAGIPLLLLIQGKNKKVALFRSSKKEELLEKTSYKLPNKAKLLDLEKLAKREGSGIKFDSLIGNWKFVSVWEKNTDKDNSIFSSLLRIFSANIEFKKDISTENPYEFAIITSINFGILSIEFSGPGYLRGKQPCLPFFFNLIELKSGSRILLSRYLHEPLKKETSFFEVIGSGQSEEWLSVRGQGGAIVLWLRD